MNAFTDSTIARVQARQSKEVETLHDMVRLALALGQSRDRIMATLVPAFSAAEVDFAISDARKGAK